MRWALAACVLCGLSVGEEPPAGELVRGTKVRLVPPRGFAVAERFPGFLDETGAASVMVTVLPAALAKMQASFTDEALGQRGMRVIARTRDPEGAASKGSLLEVRQRLGDQQFRKWMFAFGNAKETVLVVAAYPEAHREALEQPLRAAVLSAWLDEAAQADPEGALPFEIGTSKRLPFRRVFANGLGLAPRDYVKEPRTTAEALLIVIQSFALDIPRESRRAVFLQQLRNPDQLRDVKPGEIGEIEIDGLTGYECTAAAVDTKDGVPVAVYHVMLFDDAGYYLIHGRTPTKTRERDLKEFRRLARTFRMRKTRSSSAIR